MRCDDNVIVLTLHYEIGAQHNKGGFVWMRQMNCFASRLVQVWAKVRGDYFRYSVSSVDNVRGSAVGALPARAAPAATVERVSCSFHENKLTSNRCQFRNCFFFDLFSSYMGRSRVTKYTHLHTVPHIIPRSTNDKRDRSRFDAQISSVWSGTVHPQPPFPHVTVPIFYH